MGVPQGSCLSPLLFNIFVRDLLAASPHVDSWQFADDITQSSYSDNLLTVTSNLVTAFHNTKKFCQDKQLQVNCAKTQFILLKAPSSKLPSPFHIDLGAITIPAQPYVKLLGVLIDHHLTFKEHIQDTVNTCNGYLGVLRKLAHFLPRKLCTLFYTAIIRSRLEYASALLPPVAKTHLEKLDVVQRKAARIICGMPPDSHAEPLELALNLQALNQRRVAHLLKIVTDSLASNCHPLLFDKFTFAMGKSSLAIRNSRTTMGKKAFSSYAAIEYNQFINSS